MNAYSMDLRERIVAARLAGESVVSVAQRFGVCTKTVRAYVARAATGQLAARPRPGKAPLLRPEQEAAFVLMVQEKSDWTIDALCQQWEKRTGQVLARSTLSGVGALHAVRCWRAPRCQVLARSTLHDHLRRLGARYKKRVASPVKDAR